MNKEADKENEGENWPEEWLLEMLDNEDANRHSAESCIRQAVAEGMKFEDALKIYGTDKMLEERGIVRKPLMIEEDEEEW